VEKGLLAERGSSLETFPISSLKDSYEVIYRADHGSQHINRIGNPKADDPIFQNPSVFWLGNDD
jgi:hypothetical protein